MIGMMVDRERRAGLGQIFVDQRNRFDLNVLQNRIDAFVNTRVDRNRLTRLLLLLLLYDNYRTGVSGCY